MVSKERLGGLIDAIVAVIMTIMLLEFEVPSDGELLTFLHENTVYIIVYLLSFVYVTTSWFNQQYMLSKAKVITRKIYIVSMLWILSLSLLPVLAAWSGKTIAIYDHFGWYSPKAPACLFMLMIIVWALSYVHMTKAYIADQDETTAKVIANMGVYQVLKHPLWLVWGLFSLLVTWFYPPYVFVATLLEMMIGLFRSRNAH